MPQERREKPLCRIKKRCATLARILQLQISRLLQLTTLASPFRHLCTQRSGAAACGGYLPEREHVVFLCVMWRFLQLTADCGAFFFASLLPPPPPLFFLPPFFFFCSLGVFSSTISAVFNKITIILEMDSSPYREDKTLRNKRD